MYEETDILCGDSFKLLCDDYIDDTKTYLDISKSPKIIFCFTDWVELFISKILPKINYKFILVTHNADRPVTQSFINLLDDERLIRWFGMNCHTIHGKLTPIPIGIANEKWPHGSKKKLIAAMRTQIHKQNKIYCNFNPNTTHRRHNLLQYLKKYDFIDIERENLSFSDYLLKLKSYKFVISPPGNSVDCHRIWESLYLNTIPIICKHTATSSFAANLPLIEVDDYTDLSLEQLENESYKLNNTSSDYLKISYYKKLINQYE